MSESTLRAGLLTRLAPMLLFLLLLDAGACYFTALHFANVVYDQWLVDSARSLSRALVVRDSAAGFDLPAVGREVFQFDEVDRTYFRIRSARHGELAGDRRLPIAPAAGPAAVRWSDDSMVGETVRIATIAVTPPGTMDSVTIAVGETKRKRARLTGEILLGMVAPQIGLVVVAAALAWSGVSRGLKPLTDMARVIESRDDRNLRPVPETGLPREARVLVHQINELLARLDRALEANRGFLATAAHQLRTPLAAVAILTEQAERAPDLPAARRAIGALRKSVDRAVRLTGQLLAVARAGPDAADVTLMELTDIGELARLAGEEAIPRALGGGIDLGLVVPDQPACITGNAGLLSDAISNLVDNALRHSQPGGRVNVIVERRNGKIALSVEDEGPGIPAAERERVFERFYRVPGSRGEGSGLGLAIVREIAQLHGAEVFVADGRGGRGARVTLAFPA